MTNRRAWCRLKSAHRAEYRDAGHQPANTDKAAQEKGGDTHFFAFIFYPFTRPLMITND
jgi:hypothetical protein